MRYPVISTLYSEGICLLHGEVAEAFDAWRKGREDVGEELADVAIYLLGLPR